MQLYQSQPTIQWLLIALVLAAFEMTRWRKLPDVLPQHKVGVPIFHFLAGLVCWVAVLFALVSVWWFSGFIVALVAFMISYGTTGILGGILVPLIFKGDQWLPFTFSSIAIWPLSFFLTREVYRVFWSN